MTTTTLISGPALSEAITGVIIHPFFRTSGYAHIHIPSRLAKQCGITPASPQTTFRVYVNDSRLIIEQIKEDKGVKKPLE